MWKFISNKPNENEYHSETTEKHDENIQKSEEGYFQKINQAYSSEKETKKVDYREKSFEDSRLMVLDPTPKLDI